MRAARSPGFACLQSFFQGLFGGGTSSSEPEDLVTRFDAVEIPEFKVAEVQMVLGRMSCGKMSGLASFLVDVLRDCH